MPRASLVSLVASLALPQTLVSAGDNDDDGYFSMFPSGPVLPDLGLPGSGAKSDDSKAAKEEPQKPIVAPEDAYTFGPKNCIKTWLDTNRCMMQTDCKEEDIKDYMFHLICMDRGGEKAKHTFGVGSFEPKESFDTLITCAMCSGEKVIDTQLTAKQVDLDAVNPKEDPAKAVQELVGAVREMKEEMKGATVAIKKLNAQVFSDEEGAQAPAAVAEAEAPPVKFVAEAQPRDEEGRLPEMKRFLAHRKSAETLKTAAEAGRENMAMHRAAAGLDRELGGLHEGSGMHASKLQRIKRERSAKHHNQEEVEHEEVAEHHREAAEAKLEAREAKHHEDMAAVAARQAHQHHKKHHKKAHVQVQEEAVADAQDEQSTDAQAESDSQDQSDVASQDKTEGESQQGADAQDGEETVDDASQEGAAEEGEEQQEFGSEAQDADASQEEGSAQESGAEAQDADASQDEGSAQAQTLNMKQQQESGVEAQEADASQVYGSAQASEEQGQDSPVQVTQAEAQDQDDSVQQTDQSAEGDEQEADTQEADVQAQDTDEPDNHGEYKAALVQTSPQVRGSRHRAMLLQQQSDSTRVRAEAAATTESPEPVAEYDMSDAFQAEQKHKDDLALN